MRAFHLRVMPLPRGLVQMRPPTTPFVLFRNYRGVEKSLCWQPARLFRSSAKYQLQQATRRSRLAIPKLMAAIGIAALYTVYVSRPLRLDDEEEPEPRQNGMISYSEVQKHTSAGDCWVIVKGHVYDLSDFLEIHPGGAQAILLHAGKDASETFAMMHPPDALGSLPPEACLGPVDPGTLPVVEEELDESELLRQIERRKMPHANEMLLLQDFENWAERVLSDTAWAYYRSATDEERTFNENRDAFRRYFFRPRILKRDMTHGDTATSFVGIPSQVPFFISPAAMAKLGHPLGELNLTRAAGEAGVVQAISSNASCSLDEMFEASKKGQPLIFQLYLNKDRTASEKLIRKVEGLGARAIMFTVDTPWDTKRTLDERAKVQVRKPTASMAVGGVAVEKTAGVGKAISGYQDRNLTWKDIGFIRGITKLPIIVKGVQSLEDVQACVDHGVEGVVISNHGGRQADYAPAPIDILYEIRSLKPGLFDRIDIMIDGGVRTGADVVKALALGAKAVGLGRPFLYANGTHGQAGARRVIEILQEEVTTTMRNIGASRIEELRPEMVGPAGPWVGSNRPPYMPKP